MTARTAAILGARAQAAVPGEAAAVVRGAAVVPGLFALLDGLRAFLAAVAADDTRDPQTAVELAAAELAVLCQLAPAWCPGCPGRGPGLVCGACRAPVPAALRRRDARGGDPR